MTRKERRKKNKENRMGNENAKKIEVEKKDEKREDEKMIRRVGEKFSCEEKLINFRAKAREKE